MKQESGNILWIILVSIALIGAVTATFTRSSSTSDDTGEYERNMIAASEIMRYAKSLEVAVQNLLMRGCSENELSFWHDSNGDGAETGADMGYNATARDDKSCHIFRSEGAGLEYKIWNASFLDGAYSAQATFGWTITSGSVRIEDIETTNNELVMYIPWLNKQVCAAVNQIAGIGSAMPSDNFQAVSFAGNFTPSATPVIGDEEAALAGKTTFCAQWGGTWYYFMHVLLAR
jgi:hypothetical protein